MKNIHILPTDKPSRLWLYKNFDNLLTGLTVEKSKDIHPQHIYITSDEEIKEGDWCLSKLNEVVRFGKKFTTSLYKKIILTTDQDLIKDGIQAISDEFIELFVKNLNREWVEVIYDKDAFPYGVETAKGYGWYQIIIPQEEPKYTTSNLDNEKYKDYSVMNKETLEEANWKVLGTKTDTFYEGAKWQAKKSYNEAIEFAEWIRIKDFQTTSKNNWIGLDMKYYTTRELFEKFKKK
jgi:hypothetical protein